MSVLLPPPLEPTNAVVEPDDVAAIASAVAGGPGSDAHLATTKAGAQQLEADVIAAVELQRRQNELFWDAVGGGWFSTTGRDSTVLLRMKEDYDGAEPTASAVSVMNLLTLSHLVNEPEWAAQIDQTFRYFGSRLEQIGRAGVARDVPAEFAISLIGAHHHRERVPAHQRAESLLDRQVTGERGLLLHRDRVHVRRREFRGPVDATQSCALRKRLQDLLRAQRSLCFEDAVEGIAPFCTL